MKRVLLFTAKICFFMNRGLKKAFPQEESENILMDRKMQQPPPTNAPQRSTTTNVFNDAEPLNRAGRQAAAG